ncbi:hypothetical protein D3C76_766970 [compost metagenome]
MQVGIVRDQLLHLLVGLVDVFRITGQGHPAEGANALAEQRANVGRYEAGEVEGVFHPLLQRHLADVISIIERGGATGLQGQHGFHLAGHGVTSRLVHLLGRGFLQLAPLGDAPPLRQVAMDRVVGRGLVGHHIRGDAAGHQLGEDVGGVAEQADGDGGAALLGLLDHGQRLIQAMSLLVDVAGLQAKIDAGLVALHGDHGEAGHGGGQGLSAAHATQAPGEDPAPLRFAVEVLVRHREEGLVGALHYPLGADVDPRAGGHLAVHHQTLLIEFVEVLPVGPVGHQVGVGDQHPGRVLVGLEHPDRLAGLHQQGLVVLETGQHLDDLVVAGPVAGGAADAAIDHQGLGMLGHFRIQVVHQHPQRRLGQPALGGKLGAVGGADDPVRVVTGILVLHRHRHSLFINAAAMRGHSAPWRVGRLLG